MAMMDIATARKLAEKAMEVAERQFQRPVCVAIVDVHGFLVAFARGDGTPVRSIEISQGKAYTAARMGRTTAAFHELLQRDRNLPADYCDPRLTSLSGGAPVKASDGSLIGAVGISGLKAHEDQTVAETAADSFAGA